eukprot:CAMPEP_0197672552 /NCGR_PEP_ID=MMETSP1338-20131121/79221_1 /TAXON_ID=43686 ORGANISM="Pelagodinium beii, Strain RCC1491" /NCGR_SAMPLE_ID=MMETSP1338 /ASSEMBLY_ACC=CAM_ASM_000754 /LENGTH=297 /DNA_ID=CAMNT_0043252679 /DNA_START=98 /DNA_END=988 /DNA_ORIENTATION=-
MLMLPPRCYFLALLLFPSLASNALHDSPGDRDAGQCGPESQVSFIQRKVDIQLKIVDDTEKDLHEIQAGSQIPSLSHIEVNSAQKKSEECMASDFDALLKGLQQKHQESFETVYAFPLIALLIVSAVTLLMGHKLVTPVVLTSTALGSFYLTFEIFLQISTSCSLPVYAGAAAGLLAGAVVLCFLELAIVIPGAIFGAVLAYQIQSILLAADPSLSQNLWMVDYFWSIATGCALVFAYIAHTLREDIFILITSVLGAFGIEISVRGILEEMSYEMSPMASAGCMVVALVMGLVVQHR